MIAFEIVVILFLILLNGFLAMSELAVVSARRSRLQALAEAGDRRALGALRLAEQPGRFLSTVQIGITLCAVFAGTFSGATVAEQLAEHLATLGLSVALSGTFAFIIVVAGVTYLSLIVGELVPKQLALRNAERIAMRVASTMIFLSRITAPLGYVLDGSSRLVLHLVGLREEGETRVSDEEIKALVAEAESTGMVEPAEKRMISSVLRLGDRSVHALLTPRREIDWIDLDADQPEILAAIQRSHHSRLVAAHGSIDEVVGVVPIKAVLDTMLEGRALDIKALVRPAPVIHDRLDALAAVDLLRQSEIHMALVVDEHGSFEGVVTRADILSSIVGDLQDSGAPQTSPAVRRKDGSWLFDGSMPVDEMAHAIGVELPADRDYRTVAGFVLDQLRHMPIAGESVTALGWRFEVVDMDGRRIDKVLASKDETQHGPHRSSPRPD